jgi:hypothetical protein
MESPSRRDTITYTLGRGFHLVIQNVLWRLQVVERECAIRQGKRKRGWEGGAVYCESNENGIHILNNANPSVTNNDPR